MDTVITLFGTYYGLDWASMVLGFFGMYLLSERNRLGFVLTIGGALLAVGVSIIASQYGFIFANFVNICLALWGIYKWGKPAQAPVAVEAKVR